MIIKKMSLRTFTAMVVMTMLMMTFYATGKEALAAGSKVVDADSTWVVSETTSLSSLTIGRSASIAAPEGYSVTLTVDGAGTPIKYGVYKGKIVLTVTKEIAKSGGNPATTGFMAGGGAGAGAPAGAGPAGAPAAGGAPAANGGAPEGGAPGGGMGGKSDPFKTAIYIENGKYIPEKSVEAAVTGGKVTDTTAKNVKITSNEGKFSGIIVSSDTKTNYSIINPVIDISGNGGDDWTGLGSAITVLGKAEVTIDNAKITGTGYNRSTIFLGDEGVLHVNNSDLEVRNGILNSDPRTFMTKVNKTMVIGPWLMGMTGRVRATNIMSSGTAYYNNSHIKAQYWGALSTDGARNIKLYVTDCLVETVESGYGAYSIGNCFVQFSGSTLNVVDYGMIICDFASGTFTDGCVVNSKKVGVMMHDGSGGSTLTIDKGTVFNTRSSVIQIKGRRGADIIVDNAQLNTESGVILQTMPNDDPNMSAWDYSGGKQGNSRDVNATFSNMTVNGDIVNGFTRSGSVNVNLKNVALTGAITTATIDHPLINNEEITMETPEFYYLIGEVNNTYGSKPEDPNGITTSVDAKSKWIVERTSYLTGLTISEGGIVAAPEGYSVTMTVDGVKTAIKAGSYKGQIVLTVVKNA